MVFFGKCIFRKCTAICDAYVKRCNNTFYLEPVYKFDPAVSYSQARERTTHIIQKDTESKCHKPLKVKKVTSCPLLAQGGRCNNFVEVDRARSPFFAQLSPTAFSCWPPRASSLVTGLSPVLAGAMGPPRRMEATPSGCTACDCDSDSAWLDSLVSRVRYCFTWCLWLCCMWYLD